MLVTDADTPTGELVVLQLILLRWVCVCARKLLAASMDVGCGSTAHDSHVIAIAVVQQQHMSEARSTRWHPAL